MSGVSHFEVYPQTRERVVDQMTGEKRTEPTGEWGWRLRAANGQIVAVGGEGFTRREDAARACGDATMAVRQATYGQRFTEAVADAVEFVED